MRDMTRKIHKEMYALAVRIEPILATPAMRVQMGDKCGFYFEFVRCMRTVMEPDGTLIELDKVDIPLSKHYVAAFMKMSEIRNRNQCLHIECIKPVLGRTAACSRRGIVRFCTRECSVPCIRLGRPVSPAQNTLRENPELRVATLLTDDVAWNRIVRDAVVPFSQLNFYEACEAGRVDPHIAEAVWQGITNLTQGKDEFAVKMEAAKEAEKERAEVECLNHLHNLQIKEAEGMLERLPGSH
ncbi:hypothetical protein B0H13DRAFT_2303795 [Mycena leptocephala]|nr:hypothetical protein B0H13DRAFT_2303795 [Mycena leptocephala]